MKRRDWIVILLALIVAIILFIVSPGARFAFWQLIMRLRWVILSFMVVWGIVMLIVCRKEIVLWLRGRTGS
jgi:hypothetical protein